jgi:hypothetical protein
MKRGEKQKILKALEEKILEAPPSRWQKKDGSYESSYFGPYLRITPVKGEKEVGGYLVMAKRGEQLGDEKLSFSYYLGKPFVGKFVRRLQNYDASNRRQLEEELLQQVSYKM